MGFPSVPGMTIEEMPSAASTPAPASETPYTVTSPMSPRTHKVGASEDYKAPSATDGHLGPAAVQGGQRLQAGVEHAAVQPRRHHHQAQRQDPDHRGRRPRGAVQAEARDPRQHRSGRHVLLLLLRRGSRDQGSKDEVNSDSPSSLTYRFLASL